MNQPLLIKDFNINLFIHFSIFSVNNQSVSTICLYKDNAITITDAWSFEK